jgi:ABC-type Fe3+ transport system permease subunit
MLRSFLENLLQQQKQTQEQDGDNNKPWYQSALMFLVWIAIFFFILFVQTTLIYLYKQLIFGVHNVQKDQKDQKLSKKDE